MASRIAILGTGRMGAAAAERLASRGYTLYVWNRSREKAESLAKKINARVSPTAFDAVQSSEYALIFLSDEDAIYSVMSTFHRMDGAIIINHSTITPQGSERFSGFVNALGGCYVESPLIGGPSTLKEGKAIALVAGPRHCKNTAKGVIGEIASDILDLGDEPYKATVLKLAHNTLLIGVIGLFSESLLLAESYGVDAKTVRELLGKTAFGPLAERYIERMMSDPSKPGSFSLALAMKDLDYSVRAGFYKNLPQHVTGSALNLYRQGVRSGYAESDYTAIYHALKGRAKQG